MKSVKSLIGFLVRLWVLLIESIKMTKTIVFPRSAGFYSTTHLFICEGCDSTFDDEVLGYIVDHEFDIKKLYCIECWGEHMEIIYRKIRNIMVEAGWAGLVCEKLPGRDIGFVD